MHKRQRFECMIKFNRCLIYLNKYTLHKQLFLIRVTPIVYNTFLIPFKGLLHKCVLSWFIGTCDLMIDYKGHLNMFSRFNYNTSSLSKTCDIVHKCVRSVFNDFLCIAKFVFFVSIKINGLSMSKNRNHIKHLRGYITCTNNTVVAIFKIADITIIRPRSIKNNNIYADNIKWRIPLQNNYIAEF